MNCVARQVFNIFSSETILVKSSKKMSVMSAAKYI